MRFSDKEYQVALEISGTHAMFTRPDTGASFVSYPAPTWSAAKAMFEAVARLRSAYICPTHVHICQPVIFQQWVTNYMGPLRKRSLIPAGSPYQLPAHVLVDVCYQIFGVVREISRPPESFNHLHYLQAKFCRRLRRGSLHSTPVLGWSEFTPDYFGPLRPENGPLETVNETIPSMLVRVFDRPSEGQYGPVFQQNVSIEKGILRYNQEAYPSC